MILTTEGIVLRGRKFSESSKILTFYTRSHGKVSLMAKGARRASSRFASSLEPMSYVTAVMYYKEGRDLQLLSACDTVESFRGLTDDLDKMAAGMAVIELVNAVSHAEERNDPLFDLLAGTLRALNSATKNTRSALYFFEIRLLDIFGFRPSFHRCVGCGIDLQTPDGGVRLGQGGAVCRRCAGAHHGLEPVSPGVLRILQRLQELRDPESALAIALTAPQDSEIAVAVRRLLAAHIEGVGRLPSQEVFSSIGSGAGRRVR